MACRLNGAQPLYEPVLKQYSSIGSDNALAPSRRQAIIWTNDG